MNRNELAVKTLVNTEQNNEATARDERAAALATLAVTREEERSERDNDDKHERYSESETPVSVKLRLGDALFEVEKKYLAQSRTYLLPWNAFFWSMAA